MKKNILLFIVLFLGFCNNTLYAQLARLYTTESELSSSLITQICQDHEGMIWIAIRKWIQQIRWQQNDQLFPPSRRCPLIK